MLDPRNARPDTVLFARKALIETAFLVGLRARLDEAPLAGDFAAILEQVEDVARQPSYRELIARDEAALLLYAGTYAALRLCGRDDPEFRRIIQQAAAGGYAAAFERVPYRQLDLLHTLHLCGIEHGLPAMDDVLPFTVLCRRPNVLKMADRDIYAITHTIFYVTDFGRREPVWPRGYSLGEAVELLEALLVLAEARANADLVGELLCCLLCLGVTDSDAADQAWRFLESVQEDNGRVNGPKGVIHPGLESENDDFRHWAEGYHTTIVAALAGLLERSPRRVAKPRPGLPVTDVVLVEPLRRAVLWLCDRSMTQDPRTGLPGVTAAAVGASAIEEHRLVRPALEHYAASLADADPEVWQEQGMEIAGEFAMALRTAEVSCPSLEEFLKATATVVDSLDSVPADVMDNVQRLVSLGLTRPSPGTVIPEQPLTREHHAYPLHAATTLCEARGTYHLGQLAATVRTLVHDGWRQHRITRDAIAFLIGQQSADGAFGYPACDDQAQREKAQFSWTRSVVTALASATRNGE
ncbi:hypothetical protein OG883_16230 [Streptomyces sp. NBC_01142]|uniref:DUF6895 family protein n=1 Tax=Streptomyces sp. NBC_01142 TaxID=2975865 RepID=UPI00225A1DA1|nr:hypothetical protein [Streptomyces sp. NBC_01142]MCX4821424.1 hypothetical protein [Streptomyces sp. NBC_01142]